MLFSNVLSSTIFVNRCISSLYKWWHKACWWNEQPWRPCGDMWQQCLGHCVWWPLGNTWCKCGLWTTWISTIRSVL